jgi:Fic family protein
MIDPNLPSNDLPKLPPGTELETNRIMRKLVSARVALAEMKATADIISNQHMLINTLILREAKDSSEIENIVTTQDELYIALATEQKNLNPRIKEVLNYRQALWFGYNLVKSRGILTTNDITGILQKILGNNAGIRTQPGTQLKNALTGKEVYTPAEGADRIRRLLKKIKDLLEGTIQIVKSGLPSVYSKDLIEIIFEQPYCRVASIVSKGLYERRTAMKYLRELESIGVLKS